MLALIPVILTYLPEIMAAGEAGYKFVHSVRAAAQQSGEWTEANEADFQSQIAKEAVDPAWQLDAPQIHAPVVTLTAATVIQASQVTDQAAPAPELALEDAAHPVCEKCGAVCAPNHPENCSC